MAAARQSDPARSRSTSSKGPDVTRQVGIGSWCF